MLFDNNRFLIHNYDEFVHVRALKNILKNTPDVTNPNVSAVTGMIINDNGTVTITYIDNNNITHTITLGGSDGTASKGTVIESSAIGDYVSIQYNDENIKNNYLFTIRSAITTPLNPNYINLTMYFNLQVPDLPATVPMSPKLATISSATYGLHHNGIQMHPFFDGKRCLELLSTGNLSYIQLVGDDEFMPTENPNDNAIPNVVEFSLLLKQQ